MRKARAKPEVSSEERSAELPESLRTQMLGWLPVLGEWYRVNSEAKIFGFMTLAELLQHYEIGKETKSYRVDPHNATGHIWMMTDEEFLVTRLTVPYLVGDPAVIEIFSKEKQKNLYFCMYPPMSAMGARVWEMMMTRIEYESKDE